MKLDLTDGLNHKRVWHRVLHDDIGRSKYPSFSSANARASANWGNDYLRDKLHEHSSSGAGGKPRHRLQMKLQCGAFLFVRLRPAAREADSS
jgi:hypothetical protein